MRAPKQTATLVEKAVEEIRKAKKIKDVKISEICNKYKLKESFIRTVLGYEYLKK